MFFVHDHIFNIPFYFFDESMLTHFAICFNTYRATAADAVICMHKKFHRRTKFFFNQDLEAVYFSVRLPYVLVPGYRHVTIDMEHVSEFDYPQVVDIDPVRKPAVHP